MKNLLFTTMVLLGMSLLLGSCGKDNQDDSTPAQENPIEDKKWEFNRFDYLLDGKIVYTTQDRTYDSRIQLRELQFSNGTATMVFADGTKLALKYSITGNEVTAGFYTFTLSSSKELTFEQQATDKDYSSWKNESLFQYGTFNGTPVYTKTDFMQVLYNNDFVTHHDYFAYKKNDNYISCVLHGFKYEIQSFFDGASTLDPPLNNERSSYRKGNDFYQWKGGENYYIIKCAPVDFAYDKERIVFK